MPLRGCHRISRVQRSILPGKGPCFSLGWKGELEALSEIARSQSHAAYIVFTKGYKSKFTYFMRTIESFEDFIDPIQEAINGLLLPTLFSQTESLPSDLHRLVTLTPAKGGLGISDLRFEAPQQFAASMSITASHIDSITTHSMFTVAGQKSTEELKRQHQETSLAFLDIKVFIRGNVLCTSVHYKPTDSHSYLLYSSSHHHMSRTPFLILNFLDFDVYVVMTPIFLANQRRCASS